MPVFDRLKCWVVVCCAGCTLLLSSQAMAQSIQYKDMYLALQPVLERVFNTKSKIKINGEHANHLVHQSILSLELRRLYVQLYAPPILKKQLREA